MTYTVSITSQGQVTIPKPIRDRMDLRDPKKVLVEERGSEIVIRKAPDFFNQFQSIKPKKKVSWEKVNETVQQAIGKAGSKRI